MELVQEQRMGHERDRLSCSLDTLTIISLFLKLFLSFNDTLPVSTPEPPYDTALGAFKALYTSLAELGRAQDNPSQSKAKLSLLPSTSDAYLLGQIELVLEI